MFTHLVSTTCVVSFLVVIPDSTQLRLLQKVVGVQDGAGLQSVTFGKYFNHSFGNVTWPAGLQSLTFERDFDQSLDNDVSSSP